MKKTIKTILLIILLAIVAVAVAGIIKFNILQDDIYIEQPDGSVVKANDLDEYVLVTEDGTTASISYTTKEKDVVTLRVDGETHKLKRTVSGSGAKYTNDDESVVYWEHQGGATIELADGTSYVAPNIQEADLLTFNIAPYKQDCVGVAPMKCLVVNGELFYDSIEGFEFEEGTEYELLVARTEREKVPADASIYQYRRVEVLKSNKTGDPDANKYDLNEPCNDTDQDCTGPDGQAMNPSDPIPDIDTTTEQEVFDALDDDSDGDSLPTEGEATIMNDENSLAVDGMTWLWKETQYSNDDIVVPADSTQFAAQFTTDGQFSSSTDCNTVGGSYTLDSNSLTFGPLFSTKKACIGETKEMEYSNMLAEVTSYMIDDNGNLVLMLKYDTGSMIFTPQTASNQEATDYNSSRSNKNSSN